MRNLQAIVGNAAVGRLLSAGVIKRQVGGSQPRDTIVQAKSHRSDPPEVSADVTAHLASSRGGGRPLTPASRAFFEPRFGQDFSHVRVHSDGAAAESAAALEARAFTTGSDVYFANAEYAPETAAGRRLLAHELTHVVQQTGVNGSPTADLSHRATREAPQRQDGAHIDREEIRDMEPSAEEGERTYEEIAAEYADEPGLDWYIDEFDGTAAEGGPEGIIARQPSDKGDKSGKVKKEIVVDLRTQTAKATENGKVVRTMPISSGKKGHATTKGNFKIGDRDRDHASSKYGKCVNKKSGSKRNVSGGSGRCRKGERYEGAPMPYFQRFNGPEGFHQGKLPGYPDSHGCVRLGETNAKWLWDWAESGTSVQVTSSTAAKKQPAPKKGSKK